MIRVNRGAFCTLKHVNVFLVDTHCMGALIRISLYVNMFRPITLMPPLRIVLCPRHIKFLWIWTSLCSLACNYKLQSVREVAVFRAAIEWKPFQMQSGCLACATSSPNQRSLASELKKKKSQKLRNTRECLFSENVNRAWILCTDDRESARGTQPA